MIVNRTILSSHHDHIYLCRCEMLQEQRVVLRKEGYNLWLKHLYHLGALHTRPMLVPAFEQHQIKHLPRQIIQACQDIVGCISMDWQSHTKVCRQGGCLLTSLYIDKFCCFGWSVITSSRLSYWIRCCKETCSYLEKCNPVGWFGLSWLPWRMRSDSIDIAVHLIMCVLQDPLRRHRPSAIRLLSQYFPFCFQICVVWIFSSQIFVRSRSWSKPLFVLSPQLMLI